MLKGIGYLLDFLALILWAAGVCQEEIVKEKKRWVLAVCFLGLSFLMAKLEGDRTGIIIINLLLPALTYMILVREAWMKKIVIYLFSSYYLRIFYELMGLVVKIIMKICQKVILPPEVLESVLVVICVSILAYEIQKREGWVRWIRDVPAKYYLIGFFCAFSAATLNAYIGIEIRDRSRRVQILVLSLTLAINLLFYTMGIFIAIVDSYRQHYKRENVLKDQYLQLSQKHYESLSKNIRAVRSVRHDMRAHMNAIAYLADKGEWEKLQKYVKSARDTVEGSAGPSVNVNHDLVNAIIADALAGNEDVAFQCEGLLPSRIAMDDFDLCTIFSNLFSNSLEACRQLRSVPKEICLKIKSLRSNLYIYMENPVEQDVDTAKLGGWTSKADTVNHGYGVRNIQTTVEKYHGDVTFQCKNQRFSAEIILWDVLK